ncbi:hypothetical protein E8E11_003383 [Didymella keratinophila]|nr:hypothetical protein E8E11_003383 [Didymella keratinophila]
MQSELAELDCNANHSNRLDIIARRMHTTSLIILHPHTAYDFVKDGPWKDKEVEVWAHMLHPSRRLRCVNYNEMELVNEVSWVTTTTGVRLPKPRNYRKFERHMLQWESTEVPGVPFEIVRHKIQAICGDDMADDSDREVDDHAVLGYFELPYVTEGLLEWHD